LRDPISRLRFSPDGCTAEMLDASSGCSRRFLHTLCITSQMTPADWVAEPARRTPVFGGYDVVVVGGGPAGLAAAASAARR
jgi:NADPH-dependent 2,4-dienoyl-CoA reductase/sulfur reductase-like enzyme